MSQEIYDCFLFASELELLELRMKILGPYVDYFVLVESPYSFPGEKKEMIFDKNKHKFDTSKIIHVVSESLPFVGNVNNKLSRGKANEMFSRDYMREGLKEAKDNDIIILSDIDEIPNPKTLMKSLYLLDDKKFLKDKEYPHFGMLMHLFYYYMNCLSNEVWKGSFVCKYKDFNEPAKMRKVRGANAVENGGWHYSYLGGVERIQKKISRLGSVQFNQDKYTNQNHLEKCMREGKDLYNRRSKKCKFVDAIEYGPKELDNFLNKYPNFILEK